MDMGTTAGTEAGRFKPAHDVENAPSAGAEASRFKPAHDVENAPSAGAEAGRFKAAHDVENAPSAGAEAGRFKGGEKPRPCAEVQTPVWRSATTVRLPEGHQM
jgi:hypothetical protein